MKTLKFVFCLLTFFCVACSNPGTSNSERSNDSKSKDKGKVSSDLNRIEKAFNNGDTKTACELQITLSEELRNYDEISPEMLRALKRFKVKCGSRLFSIDLDK